MLRLHHCIGEKALKTLRLLTFVSLFVLVFSTWAPAPVFAKTSSISSTGTTRLTIDLAKTKPVKLIVNNDTSGTLYVRLSGPASYNFSAAKRGKTTFTNIKPGIYYITITASSCSGSLTLKRNMKGTVSLKPVGCTPHKKR